MAWNDSRGYWGEQESLGVRTVCGPGHDQSRVSGLNLDLQPTGHMRRHLREVRSRYNLGSSQARRWDTAGKLKGRAPAPQMLGIPL